MPLEWEDCENELRQVIHYLKLKGKLYQPPMKSINITLTPF